VVGGPVIGLGGLVEAGAEVAGATLGALGNAAGSFTNGLLGGLAGPPRPVVVQQPYNNRYFRTAEEGQEEEAPAKEE
jgi:hypothetical protein